MFIKRVKLILQSEDSECGQACLAMIFNYYGYGISLPELRKITPPRQEEQKSAILWRHVMIMVFVQ